MLSFDQGLTNSSIKERTRYGVEFSGNSY